MAEWTCLGCSRKFEKRWLGPAFLMGTECPYFGKVALSNEEKTWEAGTLDVMDEREEK
jgi:hypothetical protein